MGGLYKTSVRYMAREAVLVLFSGGGTTDFPIVIRNYPGQLPVISPASRHPGIYFENISNIIVDGLEITSAYGEGYQHNGGENVVLRNLWIHDTDGVDNDNTAGVKISEIRNFELSHSVLNDNFDRTCADTNGRATENSRNIVIFKGNTARLLRNVIFQTPPTDAPKTGACIGYKHDAEGPNHRFEVVGNILFNCFNAAIQTYTHNGIYEDNKIIRSDIGLRIWTSGGPTNLRGQTIRNNLFLETQAFDYRPSGVFDSGGYGDVVFMNNTSILTGPYSNDRVGLINVDPYGPNIVHDAILNPTQFRMSDNCFFNPAGTAKFGFFRVNTPAELSRGGIYDLRQLQTLGIDIGSIEADPQLGLDLRPKNPVCAGRAPR